MCCDDHRERWALGLRVRACIHTGECERVGEKLGWVAVPTLVACRARDRANLGPSREIPAGVPSAELRIVPDAVHLWNLQQPELFAKTVAEFVSSLTGTITDQAPLCGLLDRLRDLGILLVSVNSVD